MAPEVEHFGRFVVVLAQSCQSMFDPCVFVLADRGSRVFNLDNVAFCALFSPAVPLNIHTKISV
jgi:hypothetical protein